MSDTLDLSKVDMSNLNELDFLDGLRKKCSNHRVVILNKESYNRFSKVVDPTNYYKKQFGCIMCNGAMVLFKDKGKHYG